MKNLAISFACCLTTVFAPAQNLVQNGSFEIHDPTVGGDTANVEKALGWKRLNNTADLFHPMTTTTPVFGTYEPHTGVGHANIVIGSLGNGEYFYGKTLEPLVAGNDYSVTFWVKNWHYSAEDIRVGVHVSPGLPLYQHLLPTYVENMPPQATITPINGEYEKVSFCYHATQSTVHYLTFGFFQNVPPNQTVVKAFAIDDVSMELVDDGASNTMAQIATSQTSYCISSPVTIDGSPSSNDSEYRWEIKKVVAGVEDLVYSGGLQTGQAGSFNVSNALSSTGYVPHAGDCFRAYLTVYGVCSSKTFKEFCYVADPTIQFITDGSPVCAGLPVDLQVTGDNGWIYTWTGGSSDPITQTGLKNRIVTPTIGNSTYHVSILTPLGCSTAVTINLTVHSVGNAAPWMNGINGTGEYTTYVIAGQTVSFSSTLFNDNSSEVLTTTYDPENLVGNFSINLPVSQAGTVSFNWNTVADVTPTGNYHFTVTSKDNNSCGEKSDNFHFNIIVICDHCPVCISHENRTPTTLPLPPKTKTGKCITAGFSAPVEVGDAQVLFQAGETIELGEFFSAGDGFQAIVDPGTCVADCETCCDSWTGFTYDDPIANGVFYMSTEDTDPTNDYFQLTDVLHPFCAFGANGFKLVIYDPYQGGPPIRDIHFYSDQCCVFDSPSPEHYMLHSPIYWDGYFQNFLGQTKMVRNGPYTFLITLYGCNGEEHDIQGQINFNYSGPEMASLPNNMEATPEQVKLAEEMLLSQQQITAMEERSKTVNLSPNPATDIVSINGLEGETEIQIQLFDEKGVMLTRKEVNYNHQFNVSKLSPGTYYCRIYLNNNYLVKKFIKL
jgi:hypothetical protein